MPFFKTIKEGLQYGLAITALLLLLALGAEHLTRSDRLYKIADRTDTLPKVLARNHVRIEACDKNIQYNGRWLSTPDLLGRDGSFGGSNFEFAVHNTTEVWLDLANVPTYLQYSIAGQNRTVTPALVLIPAQSSSSTEGPVSFVYSINGSANATIHRNVDGLVPLTFWLNSSAVHTFKVSLPFHQKSQTLQLRGLWLVKGGQLIRPGVGQGEQANNEEEQGKINATTSLDTQDFASQRKLIEIMAPASLLAGNSLSAIPTYRSTSRALDWSTFLQDNFSNSTISTVPISSDACLTSRCDNLIVKPQETFFRSGPPGTTLHTRLWPFSSTASIPHALILSLGLPDVQSFISSQPTSKHDLPAFTDDLSHKYATFIQTIRRTAYSPSSLANIKSSNRQARLKDNNAIDESYLYNSAPSNLPIFLVLPPIPSPLLVPHSRQLKAVLHHTTSKVLNDLKWHIGDKNTFLVDTAGWLEDTDFISDKHPAGSVPDTDTEVLASDFRLTQSGHIKFAYYLSLHLCPYLGGLGKGVECPFEKHGEFVGNLFVPDEEGVGKMLEDKRVARIKEIFGI